MSDTFDVQALGEVESYPTTNITRLFRFSGTILPDAIGGGCLWMAARLGRMLRTRTPGSNVAYYDIGAPGSHTTTVVVDDGDRKLYEPSLFQVSPFSLTRFEKNPDDCFSDTYPLEGGYRVKLKFSWDRPDEILRMELLSPRGYTLRDYRYRLQAPVTVNEEDPYAGLPFMDQQDQLYIHILNSDRTKTALTLGTRTRRMNIGRQSDRLFVEMEPGFDSRFEKVAEKLQMTSKQLRDLLYQALEIHNAQYPNP
jgi:hypothetical protein